MTDWLQSDGQIINRAQKTPHESGVLWTIEMPDGEPFGVVLEKADAGSVSQFCDMVRMEYDERKEESKAKARVQEAQREPVETPVPSSEVSTSFGSELTDRLARATELHGAAVKEEKRLALEVKALKAALEAINAQEDGDS